MSLLFAALSSILVYVSVHWIEGGPAWAALGFAFVVWIVMLTGSMEDK